MCIFIQIRICKKKIWCIKMLICCSKKKTYLGLVLMPEKLKSCASLVPNGGFGDSEPLASGAAFRRITFR